MSPSVRSNVIGIYLVMNVSGHANVPSKLRYSIVKILSPGYLIRYVTSHSYPEQEVVAVVSLVHHQTPRAPTSHVIYNHPAPAQEWYKY